MNRYGIIGKSLEHSFSPEYFEKKFKSLGLQDHTYEKFELYSEDQISDTLKEKGLRGLNVTSPYKTKVVPHLNQLSEHARIIGAVNTIAFENGKLIGHNTDWQGFQKSLKPTLASHHDKALILGTGGAAKAVNHALSLIGVECRHVSRHRIPMGFSFPELNQAHYKYFKLIINCTPVGMFPKTLQMPAINYDLVGPDHYLVDLIYNPEETKFLEKGREQGCQTLNGKDMLIFQAEEAWKIWKGQE